MRAQTRIWTRIRATIRARVRIRTTIRARTIVTVEKRAREAASLGAIGHGDRVEFSSGGGSLFLKRFPEGVFSKNVPNGTQNRLKKGHKI